MTPYPDLNRQASSIFRFRWRTLVYAAIALGSWALTPWAAPAQEFVLTPGNPVFRSGSSTNFDAKFIDPGAVVFHAGKFHMFYPALPRWPYPLATGYATSEDGVTWTRQSADPVLRIEDTGMEGYGVMANSALVSNDGEWVLYFTVVPQGRSFTGAIARATSDTPLGPWKTDSQLALTPGPDGAWDATAIGNASVVRTNNEYLMYYTGIGSYEAGAFTEDHEYVGLARSTDGINWVKHDDPATLDAHHVQSDPVFRADVDNSAVWDSYGLSDTNVQQTENGLTMIYRGSAFSGGASLGLATTTRLMKRRLARIMSTREAPDRRTFGSRVWFGWVGCIRGESLVGWGV